jgi:hypothetical protein
MACEYLIVAVLLSLFDQELTTSRSAGFFWLHDEYHYGDGTYGWRCKWFQTALCVVTIAVGAFICVAGMYVTVRAIVEAYESGAIVTPFAC